ncbi:YkgJ family cysteine cluster protein [Lignipirellula cremea]|uniref:Flagellin N-methylase n=1 Tax=Lignipirellula cremea TaxID=2528010 RepID=A0A518DVK9_9BACT|nr:YkgJ family cysteine cluster protein [Lignipirellula cremea]QDU95864.1 Flagellin N-methylase [Lignipirellula cremea]
MSEEKWYAGGLQFECTGCGDCCTGTPGYVWVSEEEIAVLAAHLETDIDNFEKFYVRRIGARKSLKELPQVNFDCIFLDEARRCTVYEARPLQCRTWPFWDSNLKTKETWKQTCSVCPGSGEGKLHSIEQIEHQRNTVHL